jgi:hypothetical protein
LTAKEENFPLHKLSEAGGRSVEDAVRAPLSAFLPRVTKLSLKYFSKISCKRLSRFLLEVTYYIGQARIME